MNRAQEQMIKNRVNMAWDVYYLNEQMRIHYYKSDPYMPDKEEVVMNYLGREGIGQHKDIKIDVSFEYPRRLKLTITITK